MAQTLEVLPAYGAATVASGGEQLHAAWLTTEHAFAELAPEWSALAEAAAVNNVFAGFEWAWAWWETWGKRRSLAIITVRDDAGRLVGLAPFSIEKAWLGFLPVRRLRFLADQHTGSDYLTILAVPGYEVRVTGELVRALGKHRAEWDSIALHDAADSPLLAGFCYLLGAIGMRSHQQKASVCYYVPLPATRDAFLKGLSSHLRCNYKRRWRNLEKEGAVEFSAIGDRASLAREFPELIRLHRMRFEQRRQRSAFTEPDVLEFHAKVMERLAACGQAWLFLIRVGGETVASLYGFAGGSTFQFFQCGMHPEWKRKGVGQLMTGRAMEEAIALGFSEFDFLRGGESYKAHWAEHSRCTKTVRLFDSRRASRYAEMVWLAGLFARKCKGALRNKIRRVSEDTGDE
jgi:CelD/BcsL family acetyltransferase involved in cellulose biosynthesis